MRIAACLLALGVVACSPAADTGETEAGPAATPTSAAATPAPSATATAADPKILSLEGLGALRIGEAVPQGSGWASRGAQEDPSGSCATITSPDYPGVYAITENGIVRRITLGEGSDVKLAEGIGVGASAADVKGWFGGFREEPHKYVEGGKYLTAPNAARGESALRFEIGADGKVTAIHVGTMPQLGYVEGCA